MARSVAAAPLAGLYGSAVLLRRWMYDIGLLASTTPAVTTVSVGGLEVGGSGKTPVTAAICNSFVAAGRRPGLLTRGYGRQSRGLVLRAPGEAADPLAIGDEPAMLVAGGLDLDVAACADRRVGAQRLIAAGCDALVLDDAFSHRAIGRHVDVVVLRGEAPFGSGHFLPWGDLREPPSSLRRADLVWLHYRTSGRTPAGEPGDVGSGADPPWRAALCPDAALVHSRAIPIPPRRLGDLCDGTDSLELEGIRVLAAAGIARPDDLRTSLVTLGAQVVDLVRFRDHHRYTAADVAHIVACARETSADAVVTTPKDAVKLRTLPGTDGFWALGTAVEVLFGADALGRTFGVPWVAEL